jgi:sterol desaturase/sphingolipid hydroxylase (fatty acid hydroxylase superfamily)
MKGTGYFRTSDAINSLSAGTLSTTFGYFSKIIPTIIWAYAFRNFAIIDMPIEWFDASASGLLLWAIAMIAWDFCYYWSHRCGHEISILWAAHAVHHQSEDYNLSTALRQTSTGFLFSWIFYLPLFLIGFPPEVLITVNALNLIYQFWVHTRFVGKLAWFDRVFVSPSNHRVHHAQNEIYIDRNYGGIFILWDRMFGSFQEELDEHPVVFGVRKPLASWNPFWANLQVYAYLWFDAVRTRRWRDKIGIWFRRTGWRPADVAGTFPKTRSDLATFRKYDPPLTAAVRTYVLAQFLVAVAAVLWIGVLYAQQGLTAVVLPCMLLWAQLYSIGLLSEQRAWALTFEITRLLVITPLGWIAIGALSAADSYVGTAWLGLAVYTIGSLGGLLFLRRDRVMIRT